jgi:hypothetical protein
MLPRPFRRAEAGSRAIRRSAVEFAAGTFSKRQADVADRCTIRGNDSLAAPPAFVPARGSDLREVKLARMPPGATTPILAR